MLFLHFPWPIIPPTPEFPRFYGSCSWKGIFQFQGLGEQDTPIKRGWNVKGNTEIRELRGGAGTPGLTAPGMMDHLSLEWGLLDMGMLSPSRCHELSTFHKNPRTTSWKAGITEPNLGLTAAFSQIFPFSSPLYFTIPDIPSHSRLSSSQLRTLCQRTLAPQPFPFNSTTHSLPDFLPSLVFLSPVSPLVLPFPPFYLPPFPPFFTFSPFSPHFPH